MEIRNDIAPENSGRTPLWLWLALSVGVHALIIFVQMSAPRPDLTDASKEPIEIQQLPPEQLAELLRQQDARPARPKPSEPKQMRMAETEDAANKEIDPNAKFLSDRNQKAEKQTRAKNVDDFRKAQGTGGQGVAKAGEMIPPTGEENEPPEERQPELDEIADGTGAEPKKKTGLGGVKRDWKTLSLKDLSVGGDGSPTAATDDRLDDVSESNRTILSTREFRYFSYYHRIKELLRQYWKPTVERKLVSLWAKGKQIGEDEMVTKVLVLLDERGAIQKISRVGSSGFNELDDAAIDAFQKAGPFPNPPKGIVEDDGFVRIRWDFILKTEAAPRIQFQSSGNSPTR